MGLSRRSNMAHIVMFGLIIFTSTVWMLQASETAIANSIEPIHTYYTDTAAPLAPFGEAAKKQ